MTHEKLLEISNIISSNIVTTLSVLEVPNDDSVVQQIIKLFPVIYILKGKHGVFINLHEFVYIPGALEILLNDTPPRSDERVEEIVEETHIEKSIVGAPGGQAALIDIFPEIVNTTSNFIKQHSFSAQLLHNIFLKSFINYSESSFL